MGVVLSVLKWTLIGLAVLVLLVLSYRVVRLEDVNQQVAQEIIANPDGERARRAMLLYLPDGRMYPVNYLREDNLVYMGIDGLWWREFRGDGAPVRMFIRGLEFSGRGRVVLDDPTYVEDVFSRLRPTVPEWLPDWLNGKLVVITLTEGRPSQKDL